MACKTGYVKKQPYIKSTWNFLLAFSCAQSLRIKKSKKVPKNHRMQRIQKIKERVVKNRLHKEVYIGNN